MVIRAASLSQWEAQSNIDARAAADDHGDHGEGRYTATRGCMPERIVHGPLFSRIMVDNVPQYSKARLFLGPAYLGPINWSMVARSYASTFA
jgi:hypothetical protein